MIISTTPTLEGRPIARYCGVVTGEAIVGANIFRDIFAWFRDIVGGRAAAYENALTGARDMALAELEQNARRMGADAIVGINIDYETVGRNGSMLMVCMSGTAVQLDSDRTAGLGRSSPSERHV